MGSVGWAGFCPKPPTGLQNSREKQGKGAEQQQQPNQPLEMKAKVSGKMGKGE